MRTDVELTAADAVTVDLRLSIDSMNETIEVTGQAPLLQSQTAMISTLVSNQEIMETPLNGDEARAVYALYGATGKLGLNEPWDYNRLPDKTLNWRVQEWMARNLR